jgi:hypothetical protein
MITELKPIESLTVADLAANPIREYTNRDGSSNCSSKQLDRGETARLGCVSILQA